MNRGKPDIKVVLLGRQFAGKTSLVQRYISNNFMGELEQYKNTIGAAYNAKTITLNGRSVFVGIWDTAGSECYEAMSRMYFRQSAAAIVCYDLSDNTSFEKALFWINEIQRFEQYCQIHLCGTKYDLIEKNPQLRKVSERDVKALAKEVHGYVYETSSKTGKDIDKIFIKIAEDYFAATPEDKTKEAPDTVQINGNSSRKNSCPCGS